MRPSRRLPLSAADDRSAPPVLSRRVAAPSGRPRRAACRGGAEMNSPLAESQRDALIEAMLPDVPFDGWSRAALRAGARRLGMPTAEALALFPNGPAQFVACFSRWADRRMLDRFESTPLDQLRVSERIALAISNRLEIIEPWREAVRRTLTILALPQHAPLALRLLYETGDG